jgi:phage N-6-adenine-methyltransferase
MSETLFNVTAGEVTTDDYYTPKWVFDALNVEFDIDVAAPVQGIPWLPCKRWFSQMDNGLAQDWGGQFVWMNPPYGKPAAWVDKFIENNNGIALMAVSRSQWFKKIWDVAEAVVPTPYELKFVRPSGEFKTIGWQNVLFGLGDKAVSSLKQSDIGRVR